MATICEHLTESAKHYALDAANAFVTGNHATFALAAGTAVEHALKARLASETPTLLAFGGGDAGWFKSAWALWNYRDDADAFATVSTEVQTIGAKQALDRVLSVEQRLEHLRIHALRVYQYRNSQAHMGMIASGNIREVFGSCIRLINELLGGAEELWGSYTDLVDSLLDQLASELQHRVEEKLAKSRTEFERRFGKESAEIREAVLSVLSNSRDWQLTPEAFPHDCPACGSPALIEGTNSVETDWDTHSESPIETVWFTASQLRCEACHLVLNGSDELETAGVESTMVNEFVDPGDLYGNYEPDEDLFRGR